MQPLFFQQINCYTFLLNQHLTARQWQLWYCNGLHNEMGDALELTQDLLCPWPDVFVVSESANTNPYARSSHISFSRPKCRFAGN